MPTTLTAVANHVAHSFILFLKYTNTKAICFQLLVAHTFMFMEWDSIRTSTFLQSSHIVTTRISIRKQCQIVVRMPRW